MDLNALQKGLKSWISIRMMFCLGRNIAFDDGAFFGAKRTNRKVPAEWLGLTLADEVLESSLDSLDDL